ncbi:MAG: CoA pyrophosphatase [Pirellulaceae bacterium]
MNFQLPQMLSEAVQVKGGVRSNPLFERHRETRPESRPGDLSGTGRIAGVMILLYPEQECPHLLLTRRQGTLRNHAGQMSFPGGSALARESVREAALRETHEEIGVERDRIHLMGSLNKIYIPPSDFTVTPFLGWCQRKPSIVMDTSEVAEVISVPLNHFFDARNIREGIVANGPSNYKVPYYRVGGTEIWGATALMIDDLVSRLQALHANAHRLSSSNTQRCKN